MGSIKLKDNIYWVGVKNPELRVFDIIMETRNGTTYNAYVINDEKVAVLDAVKDGFYEEFLGNLKEVIGDKKIDYLIVHHTELDHTGIISKFIEDYPEIQIICSRAASIYLKDILNKEANIIVAAEDISLGETTLKFITAPNLHWPDTMFTYVKERDMLFTCDFLGCHYCPKDNVITGANEDYEEEMIYYYNTIMGPFSKFVLAGLNKIKDLKFDLVATSHGPIHNKENIAKYTEMYKKFATEAQNLEDCIPVFYISAYGNTETMAHYICDKLGERGIESTAIEITSIGEEKAASIIDKSKGFLVGSPTINQDSVKPAWDLLATVNPIVNRGKASGAFGSYGWSGEGVPMMTERLKSLKLSVVDEGLKFKFVPNEEKFEKADEFIEKFISLLQI
ncbi:FprA family A-type flavoprotein [uncultured Clostridium sp.]|uniref:FprA family A-type flavoprotein n=1 Tax=uncultured Clostridium sp. TaxID=59620 RepID=UPI0028E5ABFC|nr:FprA family A-type flavoprotein [uncultured Clostridium sp.]